MPSPIAAIDLIKTAMRKKGILAEGETPTAQQANDGLQALNDVLETWSIQSYAVWGGLPETFATVAGQSTYSVGPGGDWDTDRPASVSSVYSTVQGNDYSATAWTLAEYMGVGVKSSRSQIPARFVYVNDAPLGRVILYPTPSEAVTITIDTPRLLTQIPNIATVMTLPPAYARALQYAVAEEFGDEYGSPIDVSGKARSTLAIIKRANRQSPVVSFDPAIMGGRGSIGFGAVAGGNTPDQWSETQW